MEKKETKTTKPEVKKAEAKESTISQVEKILQGYKAQPNLKVTAATKFEELELDSLDTVDLVMEIEDKMGVTIEMSKEIQTIGNIVDIIDKQKAAKK